MSEHKLNLSEAIMSLFNCNKQPEAETENTIRPFIYKICEQIDADNMDFRLYRPLLEHEHDPVCGIAENHGVYTLRANPQVKIRFSPDINLFIDGVYINIDWDEDNALRSSIGKHETRTRDGRVKEIEDKVNEKIKLVEAW